MKRNWILAMMTSIIAICLPCTVAADGEITCCGFDGHVYQANGQPAPFPYVYAKNLSTGITYWEQGNPSGGYDIGIPRGAANYYLWAIWWNGSTYIYSCVFRIWHPEEGWLTNNLEVPGENCEVPYPPTP